MERRKFNNVDEYMETFSGETKKRMEKIRQLARKLIPNVSERISYNIPAFFSGKTLVIYFAGYEHHISVYPGRTLSEEYAKLAAKYASGKSTLKFPNNEHLPVELVEKFINLRLSETKKGN